MKRNTLFVFVAGLLAAVFLAATFIYQSNQGSLQSVFVSNKQSALERASAPVKGPADAKVTIVEFLDPACGTCRDFYPLVQQLVNEYPGKVRLMVRYAPLHPGSDQVVKLLEAAHRQYRFWPALELLFNSQPRWVVNHRSQPMRARSILNGMLLDHDKLDIDMNQADVTAAIEQDIQDAQTLGVKATPEFFVNGQPMPSFGYEQLRKLVADAVDDGY
jgi:protein-disulfide isomerase